MSKKKAPKSHTKNLVVHLVVVDEKILIQPSDAKAFKHFKRWAYQNLPKRGMFWDETAKLYVIDLEKVKTTLAGGDIITSLLKTFNIRTHLPFED